MKKNDAVKERVVDNAKMAEVEAELSTTAIDESVDEMSEVTKEWVYDDCSYLCKGLDLY
jgi:hypothetical protein